MSVMSGAVAQKDSVAAPPYKRFPTVPPFRLLKSDSTTVFTKSDLKKNRPVLVMLFSPDCEHCRQETEAIIHRIDEFKKIQIVMATTLPFAMMKDFVSRYRLDLFDNITVGRDIGYFLLTFYGIRNFPFHACYDKKGRLTQAFEGSLTVEKLLAGFE